MIKGLFLNQGVLGSGPHLEVEVLTGASSISGTLQLGADRQRFQRVRAWSLGFKGLGFRV